MKYFLISLFCVASLMISTTSSEEREDCWSFYMNRKYTEFDVGFKKSNDLAECQKTCFNTEYCYIVFEDTANNECYYNVIDGEELKQDNFVQDENFKEYYLQDCDAKGADADAGDVSDAGDESEGAGED
nr:saratin [Hirudo nipponia]